MRIKIKVFLLLSIPVFLMIVILFSSLAASYRFSLSLVTEMRENIYISQQVEVQNILQANVFQFNSLFQRISENLQAITSFETKILKGQVNLNNFFVDEIGNNEKLNNGIESTPIQAIFDSQKELVYNWFNKDTIEIEELDYQTQSQLKLSGYKSFLSRIIQFSVNYNNNTQRNLEIKYIFEGFSHSGTLYGSPIRIPLKSFSLSANCPYKGQYNYDIRCRQWYLEASQRERITPIEPILYASEKSSFQGTNLCQKQNYYEESADGVWIKSNCVYSVNCLNTKLTEVSTFFLESTFKSSKSIMIDPRSKIVVVNQLSNSTSNLIDLKQVAIQLFPNDEKASIQFIEEIESRISRKKLNLTNSFQFVVEETRNNDQSLCEINPYKIQQQINKYSQQFSDYEAQVKNINIFGSINDQISFSQSFLLESGENEETFVSLNFISIIEKLKNEEKTTQLGYNIQDLFVIIDTLPKQALSSWIIQLKQKINQYLLYFGISSIIICIFLIIITGKISYQVGLMIETPLIHLTNLLVLLEKEGEYAAFELIEDQQKEEKIFLSKDSKILFESLKTMIQMLSLAAVDIFKVDNTSTLLKLNYQINFFKQFNNIRIQGICSNNIGNIHFQNGRYLESLEYYHQAIILAYYEAGIYEEEQDLDQQTKIKQEDINRAQSIKVQKLKQSNSRNNSQKQIKSPSIYEQSISEKMIISPQIINSKIEEAIKETIFERKLNFSSAFFMHNITQEKEQPFALNVTTKVLNNPTKYSNNKHSSTFLDWSYYESILLDLIELNQSLTAPSFGRSVMLLTQLSLCHLKMEKIEEASHEQTLAIDNYECAIALENFRKKNQQENISSHQSQQFNLPLNSSLSQAELRGKISEGSGAEKISSFSINHTLSNETTITNQFQKIKNQKILKGSLEDPSSLQKSNINSDQEQENSFINLFKSRQQETRRKMAYSQNQQINHFSQVNSIINSSHNYKQELLSQNQKNTQQQTLISLEQLNKNNRQRDHKKIEDYSFSISSNRQLENIFSNRQLENISSSSQKKLTYYQSQISLGIQRQHSKKITKQLFDNKSQIQNRQSSKSVQLSHQFKQKYIMQVQQIEENQIRAPSNSDPIGTLKKEKLKGRDNQENLNSGIPSQFFNKDIKINESLTKFRNPLFSISSKIKKMNQPSNSSNSRFSRKSTNSRKPDSSEKFSENSFRNNNSKTLISPSQIQAMKGIVRRQGHSKTSKSILKSKVNKNFIEEDLKQIQRYELPHDIILYYIGLQEARLLLSENKHSLAVRVLTDLLEKSKFYLPYYRLACLNVLKSILKANNLNTSHIDDMQNKFDNDITLRVSTVIAVKDNFKVAAHTCLHLVNEVLTKENDMFSLLYNFQENLEQVIPLIYIKQLLSFGKYFDSLLQFISGDIKQQSQQLFSPSNNMEEDEDDINISNVKKNSPFFSFYEQKVEKYQSKSPSLLNIFPSSQIKMKKKINIKKEFNSFTANSQSLVKDNDISAPHQSQQQSKYQKNQNNIKIVSFEKLSKKKGLKNTDNKPQMIPDQIATLETDHESNMYILSQGPLPKLHKFSSLYNKVKKIIPSLNSKTEPQLIDDTKQIQPERYLPLHKNINKKDYSILPSPISFSNKLDEIDLQINLNTIPEDLISQINNRDIIIKDNLLIQSLIKMDNLEEQQNNISLFNSQNLIQGGSSKEIENSTNRMVIYNNNDQIKEDIFPSNNLMEHSNRASNEKIKLEFQQLSNNQIDSSGSNKSDNSIKLKDNLMKDKINLIFHLAVRQSIFNFFSQDEQKYKMQKKLTELKIQSKQRKCVIFITDQVGIINNNAYKMLQQLLYSTQTQLLILQLNNQEQLQEENQLYDISFNNKSIIKFFYSSDKLLQYIKNKREPMKCFDVPLMVEHFSI